MRVALVLRKRLMVYGRAFDVSITSKPCGGEVVRIEGPELQRLMQVNEFADLKNEFRQELERVRARRRHAAS